MIFLDYDSGVRAGTGRFFAVLDLTVFGRLNSPPTGHGDRPAAIRDLN
jgi:hypothetical protein